MLKDQGRLEYVNAGHPAGLLWRADGSVARLESTGPFISPVIERPCWDASAVPMAIGDQVLLYTDGISEALAEDDCPGEEGLVAAIRRQREGGRPLLDVILSEVTDRLAPNPQPDDLTLLTARRRD